MWRRRIKKAEEKKKRVRRLYEIERMHADALDARVEEVKMRFQEFQKSRIKPPKTRTYGRVGTFKENTMSRNALALHQKLETIEERVNSSKTTTRRTSNNNSIISPTLQRRESIMQKFRQGLEEQAEHNMYRLPSFINRSRRSMYTLEVEEQADFSMYRLPSFINRSRRSLATVEKEHDNDEMTSLTGEESIDGLDLSISMNHDEMSTEGTVKPVWFVFQRKGSFYRKANRI